jgi:hypothetical protein
MSGAREHFDAVIEVSGSPPFHVFVCEIEREGKPVTNYIHPACHLRNVQLTRQPTNNVASSTSAAQLTFTHCSPFFGSLSFSFLFFGLLFLFRRSELASLHHINVLF